MAAARSQGRWIEGMMRAIVRRRYGPPDVLKLEDVEKPLLTDDRVLVRVKAASLNAADWHMIRGKPYLLRTGEGLRRPKRHVVGIDLAGTVEEVGKSVSNFKPGDEVFGTGPGTWAEYVSARSDRLGHKPANLSFEQAAAVPVAAVTALQGLRDKGHAREGQKVLINGATGGVGTFSVQIAKALGTDVTAVCSTRNVELVRSLGADRVIDYTRDDFTRNGRTYDLVLDNAGNRSLGDCRRVLVPKGILVLAGASPGPSPKDQGAWIGPMARLLKAALTSPFVSQKMIFYLAVVTTEDLSLLKEFIEAGKVMPVIDRSYPLSEVPEAVRYLEEGHAQGKIVIIV